MALPGQGATMSDLLAPSPSRGGQSGRLGVEVVNLRQIKKTFKELGDVDAPFLRDALERAGSILQEEVAKALPTAAMTPGHRAPKQAFSVVGLGVKGKGINLRFVVSTRHRGVRSYEFGRGMASYMRRAKRTKATRAVARTQRGGQMARPFLGIATGGGAIGAARPRVEPILGEAFIHEWDRLVVDW